MNLGEVRRRLVADGFFLPSKSKCGAQKYRRLITETTAPVDFKDDAGLTVESLESIRQPTQLIYGSLSPYRPTHDGRCGRCPIAVQNSWRGQDTIFHSCSGGETTDRVLRFWASP